MGADDDLRSKEGIDSLAAKLLQFADKNPQQHGYMAMDQYLYNIFRGMNIHVPAILMFTRGNRVLTHPHILYSFSDIRNIN